MTSVIAVAIASNLQGAATLVGDATSILLGGHANLDFLDFFWLEGRPGMFWWCRRGRSCHRHSVLDPALHQGRDSAPGPHHSGRSFPGIAAHPYDRAFDPGFLYPRKACHYQWPDLRCPVRCGSAQGLGSRRRVEENLENRPDIDFFTLFLLMGLFVVVGGLTQAGVIERFAAFIARTGQGNVFVVYTMIVWMSVLISAFVDNIPYVATMLPVVGGVASIMSVEPNLLYFGLLCGATLGGNLTPIGASANITGIGLLRKEGYEVSAGQFMRLGIPFTLAAVTTGYILVWLLWS